ncbi:hypothetical protein EUX98_g1610 [Antrodiella citrinella]|uniref:F-box domain-containing protein n=1 Tax=Antrodiella citrinella TaxID=2447956 RepID=A0A4S4N0Z1_9APHY|nr:hypothetical protein EUX98_g1610 [Antrodiella citrinella]
MSSYIRNQAGASWTMFPVELKYAIVRLLDDQQDVHNFSQTSRESYALCIPSLFKNVNLRNREALRTFLTNVPVSYGRHTRTLAVCTAFADAGVTASNGPISEALAELLGRCTQLDRLDLKLVNSVRPSIISSFQKLEHLRELAISNCGDENTHPLSERLVVSIAASLPKLSRLTLDRVARSAMHAPELVGCSSFVPVCTGDEDVPAHPIFGTDLSLPILLRLPTLRYLRIRDTHLGDAAWSTTTQHACPIEVLDLGSCYFESPEFNRMCTERIIGNIGNMVDEFSVNTPLQSDTYDFTQSVCTPLKRLRKVHLTPLLPVENVVSTLTTLSGSPVEQLSVSCHEDDVDDVCDALKDFLALRGERPDALYPHLKEIEVQTVGDDLESVKASMKLPVMSELPVNSVKVERPAAVTELLCPLPCLARSARDM